MKSSQFPRKTDEDPDDGSSAELQNSSGICQLQDFERNSSGDFTQVQCHAKDSNFLSSEEQPSVELQNFTKLYDFADGESDTKINSKISEFLRKPEENSEDACWDVENARWCVPNSKTFQELALDVSYGGPNKPSVQVDNFQWENSSVVDYLESKDFEDDRSTSDERVESLRELLEEADIHEGHGDLSDFLYHVARTKHGRIYIRVIRNILLSQDTLKDLDVQNFT
ncbi:uncharacterized protein [Prorops nasuta]|uniref:uncharacterized protein n=1 Tax=Prorops nasuta TaxID=863751 RepID=UPI0034CF14B7